MIASLIYNTPELIPILKSQLPEIFLIDVSEDPLEGCNLHYNENLYWVGNWDKFLKSTSEKYVWMLNSDITGASTKMYNELLDTAKKLNTFMVTPSFNSPHVLFHNGNKYVNWVDMCCPLINVEMYKDLGGFDLDFKGYGADIDLCYRARKKLLKMYVTNHVINHVGGYSVIKNNVHIQSDVALMNNLLIKKYNLSYNYLI